MRTILHHNGSVTYYSLHKQAWVRGASFIPASEIATYPEPFRTKLIKHLNPRRHLAKAHRDYAHLRNL